MFRNPFLYYKFHPVDPEFVKPFAKWGTTLRHPKPIHSPNATSDVEELISLVHPLALCHSEVTSFFFVVFNDIGT